MVGRSFWKKLFWRGLVLFDVIDEGNDWKLTIEANYLFSNVRGNLLQMLLILEQLIIPTCPDEIVLLL